MAEQYGLDKVFLFGSRARGDHSERSDIDLAVQGGNSMKFAVCIDEEIETLLTFDVVELDKPVQKELWFNSKMIDDEENWLDMLNSRNNVAHSYNEEIAIQIIRRTQQSYIDLFEKLKDTLERIWR